MECCILIFTALHKMRCLVPRRRLSAGKQGALGVVGRMQNEEHWPQCTYPTTPGAPSYNNMGRLGTRQHIAKIISFILCIHYVSNSTYGILEPIFEGFRAQLVEQHTRTAAVIGLISVIALKPFFQFFIRIIYKLVSRDLTLTI